MGGAPIFKIGPLWWGFSASDIQESPGTWFIALHGKEDMGMFATIHESRFWKFMQIHLYSVLCVGETTFWWRQSLLQNALMKSFYEALCVRGYYSVLPKQRKKNKKKVIKCFIASLDLLMATKARGWMHHKFVETTDCNWRWKEHRWKWQSNRGRFARNAFGRLSES